MDNSVDIQPIEALRAGEPGWRRLGTTPLTNIRLPLGVVRVKAEKPGFEAAEDVTFQGAGGAAAPSLTLIPAGTAPADMVRAAPAPGGFTVFVFGLSTPRVKLDGFWIDRHEVTNRQFKAFVDAGGYRRREFWRDPFVTGGRTLPFEEAMALFHDATGRPGPATWTVGSYPEGEDDFPVSGVSWYEASAYAAFAGKALPTIYHWYWVASQGLTGYVIPFGRYNAARPLPVNRTQALHRFGARDLAGNVKEWCLNDGGEGRRYILGGGFDESPYLFRDADARSPFDRGANFGFRTVKYDAGDQSAGAASGIVLPPSRAFADKKPASDEVFAAYRRQYSYDRTDLAPKIEAVDQTNAQWRVEKVSYAAAYGAERVILYLFLPTQGNAPYQPIVYMPAAGAWDQRGSPPTANPPFGFLLRSGRAIAFPIYKGSYERSTAEFNGGDDLKTTSRWRDYVIMFSKDLGRTLDYLATRSDIDSGRTGFYGVSRGAALAPVMLAVEPRIKAAALWIPGLYRETIAPEVDAVHFAPRVTIPVLQLSGRYDYNFPDETSSAPFFQALGTRADQKRRVIYDTGHNLPPNDAIRETLNWFDLHLGPADAARGR
jgi:formylglycine-generating enzyme required for sulfatase activity